MNCRMTYKDGREEILIAITEREGNMTRVRLPKAKIADGCAVIDFMAEEFTSGVGEGYMLAPRGTKEGGTMLCRFRQR